MTVGEAVATIRTEDVVMFPLFADVTVVSGPMPGYALGWGTLSLINAGLAQSKNHSGFLWWFISLFLGPIATFLIVALLSKRELIPVAVRSTKDFA
jgi:hypothetical protein